MVEKRKFGKKYYTAYAEVYGKKQAREYAERYRKKGWLARVTKGVYIGSYTIWIRKRR